MADLNVVVAGVGVVSQANGTVIPTVTAKGVAGGNILPGQVVYADPSANNVIKPASGATAVQATNVVGIALGSASPNQPITYGISGDIALQTSGAGSILLSGLVYALSNGIGSIAPVTDTITNVSVLGVGNGGAVSGTALYLRLGIIPYPFIK